MSWFTEEIASYLKYLLRGKTFAGRNSENAIRNLETLEKQV